MNRERGAASAFPDSAWKRSFRRQLLAWFRLHARDLPWRRTRDPYCIWLSEIMLQQTQVVTVVEYFQRFVAEFPSVASLAAADEERVLRLWEGLGYYRRARQLHQAARRVMAEHGGRVPRDLAALQDLPGIGRYTAGAIASIAWDLPAPILEANTIRLFCRLLGFRESPASSAAQTRLWQFSASLLPRRGAGTFNQALMELGSQVCTPRAPHCDDCPARRLCPTRAWGLQEQIPASAPKTVYEEVLEAALVIRRGKQLLLRRCAAGERWAGLWDVPRFAVSHREGAVFEHELREQTLAATGLTVSVGDRLATLKHGVTRFRITLLCHAALVTAGRIRGTDVRWVELDDVESYPLSTTGRKIVRLLT